MGTYIQRPATFEAVKFEGNTKVIEDLVGDALDITIVETAGDPDHVEVETPFAFLAVNAGDYLVMGEDNILAVYEPGDFERVFMPAPSSGPGGSEEEE